MTFLDFSHIPQYLREKIGDSGIASLNSLFSEEGIQTQLTSYDIQRSARIKKTWIICLISMGSILGLLWFFGDGHLGQGFSYTAQIGNSIHYPIMYSIIGIIIMMFCGLYAMSSDCIDLPLKIEIMKRLGHLIHKNLKYSHDGMYAFNATGLLQGKDFLNPCDQIDHVEDSMELHVEKDDKTFMVNGFELQTSAMKGSGKNRHREVTNHDYLMMVHFPQIHIPLTKDLMIKHDEADTGGIKRILTACIIGICAGSFCMSFITLALLPRGINIGISMIAGIILGYATWIYQKQYIAKNRITIEHTEFEGLFDIKCADPTMREVIMTPILINHILTFVQKTGNQYEFLFEPNTIYIKRKILDNYLEVGTGKDALTNLTGFAQFYLDMRETLAFIDDMYHFYLSKTISTPSSSTTETIPREQ